MDVQGLGPVDANSNDGAKPVVQVQAGKEVADNSGQAFGVPEGMDKQEVLSIAQQAVDNLNDMMKDMGKDLKFHLFVDGTDLAYVEVVNPETQEVIKEVPPKQFIEAMIRIHDAVGMILDEYI